MSFWEGPAQPFSTLFHTTAHAPTLAFSMLI